MRVGKVSPKGQIVIPAELRKRFGIKPGSKVVVTEEEGRIVVLPLPDDPVEGSFGLLKGSGLLDELRRAREEEKEHERRLEGRRKGR